MADDTEFSKFVAEATTQLAAAEAAEAPATAQAVDQTKVESTPAEAAETIAAKEEPKPEPAVEKIEPEWKKAAEAEKAKRIARQQSKGAEVQLKSQLDAVTAKLAKYEALDKRKETDPLGALEEFGLSYDRVTKEYIKTLDDKPDPTKEVKTEVQQLRENIQEIRALLKEQSTQQQQKAQAEAVAGFTAEVKSVLEAKGEQFELVKAAKQGPDLVREIVAAHYRATAEFDQAGNLISPGELMATEEACALAEKHLEDELSQFKSTKKYTGKVEAKTEEKPAKKPDAQTLTQDLRQGGTKAEPYGSEVDQLLAMKKMLEAQMNASQGA